MPDLTTKSLDYRDLAFDEFLSNLQGNILKGHGRDNTTNIFIRFNPGKENQAKEWLKEFSETVTSFKEQLRQRELFKRNNISSGLFTGIYLTKHLYDYLGLPLTGFDNSFVTGMENATLNDPAVSDWEPGFQNPVHAMILLAHTVETELGDAARDISGSLEDNGTGTIVNIEYGSAIRNANGDGLEHFGYVDGISQPLFLKIDVDEYINQNIAPIRFDPSAELGLVLVEDPLKKANESFGSYFVFRKLEQNVKGFKEAEEAVAASLGLSGEDEERAGAMIVGRFEDGTPVTLSKTDHMISSGIMNNFDYKEVIGGKEDSAGARCPFHGHIRKTNPRRNDGDKTHIMARRGITYGHRNVSTTIEQTFVQMPSTGVGLLFMSFQKDISNQFEFIQRTWANNETFPSAGTGLDGVIGQGAGSRTSKYAVDYNDATTMAPATFNQFVTMKGGAYFFAPSIPFLKGL